MCGGTCEKDSELGPDRYPGKRDGFRFGRVWDHLGTEQPLKVLEPSHKDIPLSISFSGPA